MGKDLALPNGKMNRARRNNSTRNETLFCIVSGYSAEVIMFGGLGGRLSMSYAKCSIYNRIICIVIIGDTCCTFVAIIPILKINV